MGSMAAYREREVVLLGYTSSGWNEMSGHLLVERVCATLSPAHRYTISLHWSQ